jgi:hypothetical protein
MTISNKHKFVSGKADGGDATLVRPSNWNDEHDLTLATDRLLGRDTAGDGVAEEIQVTGGLEFTGAGGIRRSALTGDVTASAGSNTTTIANDAVTYAKMQNVSTTDRVLGRQTAGGGDVEEIICTAAGRALLDDASASAQRDTLQLGTANSPQFTAIELGHASDTTLARSAAGVMTVEGVEVVTLSRTQTLTNKTLTSPVITSGALTDPVITGAIAEDVFTITDAAGFEIDPSNGTMQNVTLGASRTPLGTNFAAGESVTLRIKDGTAYTITWTSTTFGPSGVIWSGGTAPTLDTTNWTVVVLWKEGSQVYGKYIGVVA